MKIAGKKKKNSGGSGKLVAKKIRCVANDEADRQKWGKFFCLDNVALG